MTITTVTPNVYSSMSSNIAQQKKLVEQLHVECSVNRIPLTESLAAMVKFTETHKGQDPLIVGIDKKQNPFMENRSCVIL